MLCGLREWFLEVVDRFGCRSVLCEVQDIYQLPSISSQFIDLSGKIWIAEWLRGIAFHAQVLPFLRDAFCALWCWSIVVLGVHRQECKHTRED